MMLILQDIKKGLFITIKEILPALVIFLASCGQGEGGGSGGGNGPPPTPPPTFEITASAPYIPADGISCVKLWIREIPSSLPAASQPLTIIPSRGEIRNLVAVPGGYECELCAGNDAGRVTLQIPGHNVILPDLYFIPSNYYHIYPPGPIAVTSLTVSADPRRHSLTFSAVDISDSDSIELSVRPTEPTGYIYLPPFLFMRVIIEGTDVPFDLLNVQARLENFSRPGITVLPDGRDPEPNGVPYYYYGGFFSTARALEEKGEPSSWTAVWVFRLDSSAPFTFTGTVQVQPPAPFDEEAEFKIRPYLSRVTSDSVTISWETDEESRSFVVYGLTPGSDLVAGGTIIRNQFQFDWIFPSPLRFDSFFHSVTLTGLSPGTTYYYRILPVAEPTPPESFTTAPVGVQPFSFGVIADTQKGHTTHAALVSQMRRHPLSLLLHAGDLVENSNSEKEWLTFFSIEAPLLKNLPLFPARGNHDGASLDKFFCRFFPLAKSGLPLEAEVLAYSFDYAHAHFIVLDTERPVTPDSAQYKWLVQDLDAALANPARKFTFVIHHRPLYSAFAHGFYGEGRDFLAPLYQAYDVDAVFAGHVHLYERSNVNGAVVITTGGGGGPLRLDSPILSLNPYYVTHAYTHEFVVVEVDENSFDLKVYDPSGRVVDQLHYSKP